MDKEIQRIIDKSKIIVFDMDGTLSAPLYEKNGMFVQGTDAFNGENTFSWIKYCMEHENAYKHCKAPKIMKDFVEKYKSIKKMYVLTVELSSFALYDKIKFLEDNYGHTFDGSVHFVASSDLKIPVLLEMAKLENIQPSEIVIIEDTFQTCIQANDNGLSAIHISHFL